MFTLKFITIYKVNGIDRYLEMYSAETDNVAILAALLQYQEVNFLKLTVKNRSKIDRKKSVPNKW